MYFFLKKLREVVFVLNLVGHVFWSQQLKGTLWSSYTQSYDDIQFFWTHSVFMCLDRHVWCSSFNKNYLPNWDLLLSISYIHVC